MKNLSANKKLLLKTLSGETNKEIPVWFMRQAGRYLPEYRKLRKTKKRFLDICYCPELTCEISLQPIKRFDFDAAIIFSDILVILDALGIKVDFIEKKGPIIERKNNILEYNNLKLSEEKLHNVYKAITITKNHLNKEKTLIGFAGAPWTLACYLIEGGSSSNFSTVKKISMLEKELFTSIINILTKAVTEHLLKQIEAGADVIQIFDSWAGIATSDEMALYCVNPVTAICKKVKQTYPHVPIIVFPRGVGIKYLDYLKQEVIDAISVDQFTPMEFLAKNGNMILQGNIDPAALAYDIDLALLQTKRIKTVMQGRNFIFNLGHGIQQDTPIKHVHKLIEEVKK